MNPGPEKSANSCFQQQQKKGEAAGLFVKAINNVPTKITTIQRAK